RVPAPAPWVCSELAFRRALRWVESPEYGRRSMLHDSIVAGLAVSTRHDSRRGRLRASRGTVPGPRSHCIPMCRAPGPPPSAARSLRRANRKRCPPGGSEKRGGPDARALLWLFPHRGATHPFASDAHVLAMPVGRPAYVPAMRVAGRDYVTSLGTKPAPARVMASANGQPSYDRIM